MQLSDTYDDFIAKLNKVKPRFDETLPSTASSPPLVCDKSSTPLLALVQVTC